MRPARGQRPHAQSSRTAFSRILSALALLGVEFAQLGLENFTIVVLRQSAHEHIVLGSHRAMPLRHSASGAPRSTSPTMELRHRLSHRPVGDGFPASFEQVADGLLDQPSFVAMMSDQGRLTLHDLREFLFQGGGDPAMDPLSPTLEQGAIRGVLNQRMLEDLLCVRRCSAPEDQFGRDELVHGVIELLLRHALLWG
jgi:hypothetical protein